jgi:polyisoprenoid-binding protein YceI
MSENYFRTAFIRLLVALSLIIGALTCVSDAHATGTLPAAGEYQVDSRGSVVSFRVGNLVVTTVDGTFATSSGKVTVGDSIATTRVQAAVDVPSISTQNDSRDRHLRSADFFDVARFPQMTFVSTALWGTPASFGLRGNLTIKGVTKEVVFSGRILDSGIVDIGTKIDRRDFGITYGSTIKNDVQLRLRIKLKT